MEERYTVDWRCKKCGTTHVAEMIYSETPKYDWLDDRGCGNCDKFVLHKMVGYAKIYE